MMRGLLGKLTARSLSAAGKWQQQQLRYLNIHEYQGAELMSKHGINVPRGVAVGSVDEVRKTISEVFPNHSEIVVKSQILAGGRGLGTFKSGLQGGVHIVKADQVEDIAGKMLGQILVTKQTGAQGKVVSKVYLAEKLSLVNEMYFAITLDRKSAGPTVEADCFAANGSSAHCFPVPDRPRESVIGVKCEYSGDSATDSMEEEPPPAPVEDEHFTWCCKTDGKSWQCRREAAKGNSLCEHHLSLIKSYTNKSGPPAATASANKSEKPAAAVAQSTRHVASRPKKAPQTSSSSNPYEFYYYSGFGPRWAKKRGVETEKNDDYEQEIRRSIMEEEFNYVDDDDDDDDEEEECREDRRKRVRKPVKARSLKSLM